MKLHNIPINDKLVIKVITDLHFLKGFGPDCIPEVIELIECMYE